MNRRREAQKQKLSLKDFHNLARSSLQSSSKYRRLFRPRTLLIGLTATVGISSIAYAANDGAFTPQPIKPVHSSASSSTTGDTHKTETTITVENSSGSNTPSAIETPTSSNSDAQVTINNQAVPLENGTVQRTFTDSNGSTYSVDISIDSSSSMNGSSSSSTDIIIDSSSSSTSENSNRGSPRR